MRKFYKPLFFSFILSFYSLIVFAQVDRPVRFANGDFKTGDNIIKQKFKKEDIRSSLYRKNYFVLIQFSSLPSAQLKEELKAAGIELNSYLPVNAYQATIKSDIDFTTINKFNITSINSITASYKIDPKLDQYQQSYDKENKQSIVINYSASLDKKTVSEELQNAGATIVSTPFDKPGVVLVQANQKIINSIASLPFVEYISLQTIKDKPLNYNDVALHGVSGLNADGGKNLKGRGVTVGLGDNADVSTHIDFANRLILRTPWYPDYHGTHVAGTMAGAGIIDVKYHGMAPKALIVNQLFSGIITNAVTYYTDNKMVLSNNSYFSVDAGCPGEGAYDLFSNYVDWQLNTYDHILHVVAAGNDGSLSCSPYPAFFGTVKSGWQCAKNVLTVGAIDQANYGLTFFSSRGPVNDGRIKPEVVACGFAVYSTIQDNAYGYNYGTSMSAPVATGALALMYERYRQLHAGADPEAYVMKALMCNTAEDAGNLGPDYCYGFGIINAREAVEAIDSNRYFTNTISNGASTNHSIIVPKNARRLKVMLYWPDKEANAYAALTLVNDLDLTVTEPSSTVHHPFILNPTPANVNNNAVEGVDHRNNIEQVIIENPTAGTYAVNVNGFSVPFGPQPYVVTYQILDSSVTVEYPYGGETLVPGDAETIRWSAYGSENNTFSVDYSTDNGANWTNVTDTVSGFSQFYQWTVPNKITTTALIRVRRNGTNLSGQSNFNFSILGRPTLAVSNACEGAVNLSWNNISGSTSYDVMQLVGDSMQVIANTTSNSFVVKGLNKYATYWFGVRAINGSTPGRRSLSVSAIPNSGACTLIDFNNDLKIDSILEPNSARQFFSNSANATTPVKIRIRNLSSTAVTGPFNVFYSCEGGTAAETVNATIAAHGTYDYTFTTPYTINPSGFHYNFKAWVVDAADSNHLNDTAYKSDNLLANAAITSLPVTENFEATNVAEYTRNTLGLKGNDAFDFSANTSRGRARTFVNTGFAHSGLNAITLDQTPYSTNSNTDSLTATYNLSSYLSKQLRYDFYFTSQGQADSPGNKIWIRGSENDPWVLAYDLYANQPDLGLWKQGNFNINDALSSAIPAQSVSQTFQVRFGQEGFTSANSPTPQSDVDDGFTFDDLSLREVFNDVGLTQVISPVKGGCGLTAVNPVTVQVKNYNNAAVNNVYVSYRINGGTVVTDTISMIASNATLNYTFKNTANLSAYIDYNIDAWIHYPTDSYATNDSILNYSVHNSPVINTYPYLQGFEADSGNFYAKGTNSSWQWGKPSKSIIDKAPNGKNAWVTSLTGNYNSDEKSYLYSPCFNLSSLAHPMLSFSYIFQVEKDFDFTWVEYSTDGVTWQKLGAAGSGTNWYDDSVGQQWRQSNTIWHVASTDIPTNGSNVRFRFVMSSDEGVTYEGIGIDDIHVFDKASIYTGNPITSSVQNVNGNNWIDFSSGGKRFASINSHGINLGSTNVQVYPYLGEVRDNGSQYYLDRDIVIQPSNQPNGPVSVRFYFTDSEANNLIAATGCAPCSNPGDAYELGVSKYSGSVSDENGTLDDDITGLFTYIIPDSTYIVPYDNGYYAEFKVNSFSEFWLNDGGLNSNEALPVTLLYFNAAKQINNALLQWSTQNELNVHQYIIERSSDGKNFTSIGFVSGTDQSVTTQYNYTDSLPVSGTNYYRLKIITTAGALSYSQIKKVDFGNGIDQIIIYPNPVHNSRLFIASSGNGAQAQLLDASGKLIKIFTLHGRNNSLNLIGIAKGVYQLKVFTDTSVKTEKVLVQ